MKRIGVICVTALACLGGAGGLFAQGTDLRTSTPTSPPAWVTPQAVVPRFIKFSGTLEDMASKPIVGVTDVTFALYTEEAGGTPLWYETQTIQADPLGRYTVLLGAMHANGVPVELFTLGEARWLGVEVGNLPETAQGGRVLLVSVPYALKAMDAETLGGKPASAYMLAPSGSGQEPGTTGNPSTPGTPATNFVGTKGKTGPKPLLTQGATTFAASTTNQVVLVQQSGTGYGLYATSPSNFALFGQVTGTSGTTYAVTGVVAGAAGAGVLGVNNATSGATYGVNGISNSPTGVGVYGQNQATTGFAIGTYGLTSSTGGAALYGLATAGTGQTYGILGFSNSTSGTGINAQVTATTGSTIGLIAQVHSPSGIAAIFDNTVGGKVASFRNNGVEKMSVDTSGNLNTSGAVGIVASTTGVTALNVQATELTTANTAIQGVSDGTNGTGVIGQALNGVGATGVWGISTSGLAGEFSGNVSISGSISKSSGSFKIDDPLDPANRYLYHSFVESPDMKNIYDGVVILDATGEAVVKLPQWFEVLNRDFRYQLTCIGGFAPVYIAEEIAHNQFKIAGGKAGMKVSWQVTGTRQDAWANAHRIPVEVEKPQKERGTYIHPELFGQSPERAVEWARHPVELRKIKKASKSRP